MELGQKAMIGAKTAELAQLEILVGTAVHIDIFIYHHIPQSLG